MSDSLVDTAASKSLVDKPSLKGVGCVYLLRHGRTALDVQHRSDGWLDLPLSDKGQLSLIPAQQMLKTVPLKTIYAPDLKRTHETAKIVASGTLSDPTVVKADEAKTWNLGVLAGTPKDASRPEVFRLMGDPDRAPLGGESFNEFLGRFVPWFEKVAGTAAKSGKPVLIVCSGSNLRCIGTKLFGDMDSVDLDEGGLAVLYYADGSWHVETLLGAEDASNRMS